MPDVKIVRLQSGEDIICTLKENPNTGELILVDPMTIIFKKLPNGKTFMMIAPWLPVEIIEDNVVNIFSGDVLTLMKPRNSIISYYRTILDEVKRQCVLDAKEIDESILGADKEEMYLSDLVMDQLEEDDLDDDLDIQEQIPNTSNKGKLLH